MPADCLPQSFFKGPTLAVARRLLGTELVREVAGHKLIGRIVEVEAYHQDDDAAAHSYHGQTQRNAVMFGPPGHLYVYLSYGIHCCMNVVTEAEGIGAAVLVRAVEPLVGLAAMRAFRLRAKKDRDLANGPGKLCQAFAIGLEENGAVLHGDSLYLRLGSSPNEGQVVVGPRIGITKSKALPWRFYFAGCPFVSRHKLATKLDHKFKTKRGAT